MISSCTLFENRSKLTVFFAQQYDATEEDEEGDSVSGEGAVNVPRVAKFQALQILPNFKKSGIGSNCANISCRG